MPAPRSPPAWLASQDKRRRSRRSGAKPCGRYRALRRSRELRSSEEFPIPPLPQTFVLLGQQIEIELYHLLRFIQFPGEYWRTLDRTMAYPTAFVDALTESGFLSALI